MTILQTIYDSNQINKPLFIEDFVNEKNNYYSVKTSLSKYVKLGQLKRYCQGVYYIPSKTILGDSVITADVVAERKYISYNDEVFGYYSGLKLLNLVGLSTQVPNTLEITTNKEATRKRKLMIRNSRFILRKSEIEINKDNVLYLQFLDIFRYGDEDMIIKYKDKVVSFFMNNKLSFNLLLEIERNVPMRLRKALRKSGIYDELAQK